MTSVDGVPPEATRGDLRTITAVTVGRSDWGIYRPILNVIRETPGLQLKVIAAGAHLVHQHGGTIAEIQADGFEVDDSVDMLLASDSPEAIAKSMGLGTIGFAQAFQRARPDLLLVLGDRFEMHAAAVAATPFRIPIAHVHGGEVTEGAIDDAYRHAITKYSHLHFVSTAEHARRVVQLGEEPWRVTISGAPALDNLNTLSLMTLSELERLVGIELRRPPLLVTFHPVTLQFESAEEQIQQLIAALERELENSRSTGRPLPIVITRPNADTRHSRIVERLEDFCAAHADIRLVSSLGTRGYFSMMAIAAAMVGNSSSGIIEAASFRLPVVNIGLRQAGRPRSENVIDVDCDAEAISGALGTAMTPEFRDGLQSLTNPYGDGRAAVRIVQRLAGVPVDPSLMIKKFHDLPFELLENVTHWGRTSNSSETRDFQ